MKNIIKLTIVLLALPGISNFAFSQKINDSTTPLHLLQPDYATPYGKPDANEIKMVLNRVYNYLDQATPMQLIDKNSKKVITDYSNKIPYQRAA